jgi:hypothetical protein
VPLQQQVLVLSSTVQKKKAEVKSGVKSLIGKGLRKAAGAVGKVAQKAAGAASKLGEEAQQLDEISPNLGLRASKAADQKRAQLARAGDKEGAAAKAAQAKRLYDKQAAKRLNREEVEIFDIVLEFLQAEGFAETLEEAEWLMANVIDEEAIGIILGEEITSEKGKAKAAEMIANRTTASGRAKSGQGDNVAQIKHIQRSNRDGLGGTPPNRKVAGSNWPKSYSGIGGTGNKAARRAAALKNEEYVDEAQEARNNPEKYEAGEKKKYAPVRGEKTPMPPRGNKRREDFEKWYAANVR